MKHGGKVAILGIPPADMAIDWNQVIFKGLVIKGIYGREMFETWYKMVAMLQSGLDVSPVITHHYAARSSRRPSRRCFPARAARSSSTGRRERRRQAVDGGAGEARAHKRPAALR